MRAARCRPPPQVEKRKFPVTVTDGEYEVVVRVGFPVSAAQAARVLARWWAFKEKRKRYMRDRRAGRLRKGAP